MTKRVTNNWWKTELGFKTKQELETEIRKIIASYQINTPLNSIDQKFLICVLKHHYEFDKKIGTGLKHLKIKEDRNNRYICIVRLDNSEIDISWHVALKPNGTTTSKDNACSIARYEINNQILNFININEEVDNCELCNDVLSDEVHVDHIIPFDILFLNFLEEKKLSYEDIHKLDMGLYSCFADKELANQWYNFHLKNAKLRIVHKKCNLSRKKC
jgi:hypothetical protein